MPRARGAESANDLVQQRAVFARFFEIRVAVQLQLLLQAAFKVKMRSFDDAVLVCHAWVVSTRRQAVVTAQGLVSRREVVCVTATAFAALQRGLKSFRRCPDQLAIAKNVSRQVRGR